MTIHGQLTIRNAGNDISEDQYFAHIVESLDYGEEEGLPEFPLIDFVASNEEWERAKAALLRWIALRDQDDYDEEGEE